MWRWIMILKRPLRTLTAFVKVPPDYMGDVRRFRLAQLLNFFLILMALVMLLASLFNWLTVKFYLISIIEAVLSALCFWAYYLFRTRLDLVVSGWIVSSITGLIAIILIIYTKGQRDTYALTIIYPLIAYPIHGTRKGSVAYGVFSLIVIGTIIYGWTHWNFFSPISTLFNVSVVLVIGGGIIVYYELTKEEALDTVHMVAMTDPLTGMWNRTMFDQVLDREMANSRRYHLPFTLILSDLDHFKEINDTYGHHIGDNVLKEYAAVICKRMRSVDHLSRWGGDEFALILPNTRLVEAEAVVRALLDAVRHHRFESVGSITVSMGLGEFNERTNPEDFFRAIDHALYEAKQLGRDRNVVSTETEVVPVT
jgi:diguanylate cyclase (GGDEF)-like protein